MGYIVKEKDADHIIAKSTGNITPRVGEEICIGETMKNYAVVSVCHFLERAYEQVVIEVKELTPGHGATN